MKYYIGQRNNPQLSKPYFVAYGKLSKAKVREAEKSLYGSMYLTPYESEQEYNDKLNQLRLDGYSVNVR